MAKRVGKPSTDLVDPVVNPELALVTSEGQSLTSWFLGLLSFFNRATALEAQATATLTTAKRLTLPVDGKQDASIQGFVRQAKADVKEIEQHWEITALVSRFHKRLVAHRNRATTPLEEAIEIGTTLHNRYADAERRRVQEENDRLRREDEQRQREAREKELAELEAKAVAAEEGSPELSEREQVFVNEYFANGGNAQNAAQRAGFKNPLQAATRLTNSQKIQDAVLARREAENLRRQQQVRREAPVERTFVEVKADVAKGGERTTWSADLFDAQAFLAAALDPVSRTKHGIPADVLVVDRVKLNEYARALHENIDRWPGVRHVKKTGVV